MLPSPPLISVLFQDDALLVLNKPAGLVCHPTKNGELSSLVGQVRLRFGTEDAERHLVNRLDRETSGIVLIALQDSVAREIRRLWEARQVRKEYLAIVWGHVKDDGGIIEAPLGKDERSRVAIKDCVRPDGLPATTEFRVERRFLAHVEGLGAATPLPATLLRVIPRTGRKHQIRIHLAQAGFPIVGDKLYGGDEDLYLALVEDRLTSEQRARLVLPYHALHAEALRFQWRDREWSFTAPPEPWFVAFLEGAAAGGAQD